MAAGRLLIPGWSRALDSDGAPISARISLFTSGTDALAPVYSDEELTVPLANPVQSNSAGRFPSIWASDAVTYDWSVEAPYGPPGSPYTGTGLTTALTADILIAEAAEAAADAAELAAAQAAADLVAIEAIIAADSDAPAIAGKLDRDGGNIGIYGPTLRTNIGADLAANVIFTPSGAGAAARTVQTKLREQISDADYATLAQALTAATGKRLLITQAHVVTATATVPDDTEIVGMGGSITATAASFNAVTLGSGSSALGLRVIGPNETAAPASTDVGSGIYALNETNVEVSSCIVTGFNNTGIMMRTCINVKVEGNQCFDNFYPLVGGNNSADIALYSSAAAGRVIISGNYCLSNNSAGIYISGLGYDGDVTITGNLCVATDDGVTETAGASLRRRHGVELGYNQDPGNGRWNCANNIIRNTNSTGIYVASNTNLQRGVSVIGNTISKVGLNTSIQGNLTGGITINDGGVGTIIALNTIYDFRGTTGTGAININANVLASGSVTGNTIDLSTGNGILLQNASTGWTVRGNIIRNVTERDIYESTAAFGGHTIEHNDIVRVNSNFPSIYIAFGSGTGETVVQFNKLVGTGKANGTASTHVGVFMENSLTRRAIVRSNRITGYYVGVRGSNQITTRIYDSLIVDNNLLKDNHFAFTFFAFTTTGVMPVCGNIFEGNDTDLAGAGGNNVAYIAERRNGKLLLLGQTAAPTVGTWVAGDRAEYLAPAAGGVPGAVCTTAGNPGTWKAMAALAA